MASIENADQPGEVANKVLRRAQVSKVKRDIPLSPARTPRAKFRYQMTRALQNRLALANVKIKHGWENLSLDSIEPRVDMELKRKRPGSSNETMSDTSSVSDRFYSAAVLESSPLAAPIFSDDIRPASVHGQPKRVKYGQITQYPASSNHTRRKARNSNVSSRSWKSAYHLPESSPIYHQRHSSFKISHAPTLSFVSETSTVPDEPISPLLSEEDDEDLPVHSFQVGFPNVRSSPPMQSPRTPPPTLARSARLRSDHFSRGAQTGEEDANLLMFLATSPSPAHGGPAKTRLVAPSTPPSKATPLPSSMMSTPGGGGAPFSGFGLSTPGTNLNFADFLNMTPSPAQVTAAWARTPAAAKTPLASREARRRLNFDGLLPPSNESPRMSRMSKAETGLGMDLGGELVS